ncbi:hypothetical protein E8E12_008739 [Didymella heteroderae]|uniref:Uncharacterized protein n=1 Tax=Didymella heteroderae TaxID=1769908 RepID=A0A9P4WRR5_9PLEO|nr:hypothetical protein E8E12_008739 [Didymella heteroderae]
MASWFMKQRISSGVIRGVPPEMLGGLDKVEAGLDAVHSGVSGKKIFIDPWALLSEENRASKNTS